LARKVFWQAKTKGIFLGAKNETRFFSMNQAGRGFLEIFPPAFLSVCP
jgi:hypothetical protein